MINILFALGIFGSLFILLLVAVILGHQFGRWQIARYPQTKIEVLNVAEGAIFALLGLLIAFTFASAYERFEARKVRIIEEVDAIETAYLRIDLLEKNSQPLLRETVRQYLDSRIAIYNKISELQIPKAEINSSAQIRLNLWNQAIAACKATNDQAVTLLFIPVINNMFDIATTRFAITKIHPPIAIFILLIGLVLLGSFLAGYGTVGRKGWNFIYILSYVAIVSLTIYIIIDLEFPRLGMIQVNPFDKLLVETRDNLK